jgi:rubrerythrin
MLFPFQVCNSSRLMGMCPYFSYEHLAGMHPEGEVKNLLKQLAKEELSHKEKVEYLYANTAFPQTDGG